MCIRDSAYAASPDALQSLLLDAGVITEEMVEGKSTLTLRLPHRLNDDGLLVEPSERLGSELGWSLDSIDGLELHPVRIPLLKIKASHAAECLLRLEEGLPAEAATLGHDARYWIETGRLVLELLAEQRFIPTMTQQLSLIHI